MTVKRNEVQASPKAAEPARGGYLRGQSARSNILLPAIIIVLFSGVVYGNAIFNGFVYDDLDVILKNKWITDIHFLPDIFSHSVWGFYQAAPVSNYYRPLMHVIFMAVYYGFGLAPWAFHLVNILVHAANSVLVFLIVERLLREGSHSGQRSAISDQRDSRFILQGPPPQWLTIRGPYFFALLAALLFTAHPINTEAVAWATAMTEISFALFYLLSLYLYVSQADREQALNARLVLSVFSFFLATLCKETALTLPILLVVYEYALRRPTLVSRTLLIRAFLYVLVVACYFLIRIYALGSLLPLESRGTMNVYRQVINVLPLFAQYLSKLLAPIDQNVVYPFHPITSLFSGQGIVSLLAAGAFLVAVIAAFKRERLIFFGLALILVPLLPTFYIGGIEVRPFAERYLYVPSVGLALLFGATAQWVHAKRGVRTAGAIAFLVLLVTYAALTIDRNGVWQNNYTLLSDCVDNVPENAKLRYNLGIAAQIEGKTEEAVCHLREVIAQDIDYAPAYFALGSLYEEQGMLKKALRQFRTFLSLKPASERAQYRIGNILFRMDRVDEAIAYYEKALEMNPEFFPAYVKLGEVHMSEGDFDKAIDVFHKALLLRPSSRRVQGKLAEAEQSNSR